MCAPIGFSLNPAGYSKRSLVDAKVLGDLEQLSSFCDYNFLLETGETRNTARRNSSVSRVTWHFAYFFINSTYDLTKTRFDKLAGSAKASISW